MHNTQSARLIFLGVYGAALFATSRIALGSWLPPSTEKGLWFYAGLAALLLGNLIVTPYFTKPADSLSYAVSALVAMLAVDVVNNPDREDFERILWIVITAYVAAVGVSAIVAIVLKDAKRAFAQLVGAEAYRLTGNLGDPRAVFSAVFFFAVLAFHRTDGTEFSWLAGAGLLIIVLRPLELGNSVLVRARMQRQDQSTVGELLARWEPGIFLVRSRDDKSIAVGDVACIQTFDGSTEIGVALNTFLLADERWVRLAHLHLTASSVSEVLKQLPTALPPGAVTVIDRATSGEFLQSVDKDDPLSDPASIVGVSTSDTNLNTLSIEVTDPDAALEEGRLLRARVGGDSVLFQITSVVARENSLHLLNRYGYARVRARKIGIWDQMTGSFRRAKWIPPVNEPVQLVQQTANGIDPTAVGALPGTSYFAKVNPHALVTHNTAVLGILGVGKSMLTIELVERINKAGVKAIILDITDEYEEIFQKDRPQKLIDALNKKDWGKANHKQNKEDGGAVKEFTSALDEIVTEFLSDPNQRTLVIDPGGFDAWKQTGGLFQGSAAMTSVTPAEVTRIVSEVSLEAARSSGKSQDARLCLVFEEAHSLIPEWNSASADGDREAANGTAKAILQGRKYGLGCIVVTQRTANITKTILNQCNTVFAMRVFDSTGLEYLRNYIGDDYSDLLSTLEDRHAVLFGRASFAADPLIVRLNDRNAWLDAASEVDTEELVTVPVTPTTSPPAS